MQNIKELKLNTIYNDKLDDKDFIHHFSINLNINKCYFIELICKDDCEFNLKILDSNLRSINFNNNKISDELESLDNNSLIEYKEHQDYIDENYPEEFSDESEELIDEDSQSSNDMKIILYDQIKKDNIEIVIEMPDNNMKKDAENYIKTLREYKKKNIDYNNKIYYKPKKNDIYFISVKSEYENESGDYSLIIKEVEDINPNKYLDLNKEKKLKLKKKFSSEKFSINLLPNTKYSLSHENKGVKIFLFGEGKTLFSEENLEFIFETVLGGHYLIEIMSIEDNHENYILLKKVCEIMPNENWEGNLDYEYTEEENTNSDDYILDNILLKDQCNNDIYSLYIENGTLLIDKLNHNRK